MCVSRRTTSVSCIDFSVVLRSCGLFPAVELDLVRPGCALADLKKCLQAEQEDAPLGAAMVHELDRLLPALVLEEHDGPVTLLPEIEADPRAEPFLWPVDHLPQ